MFRNTVNNYNPCYRYKLDNKPVSKGVIPANPANRDHFLVSQQAGEHRAVDYCTFHNHINRMPLARIKTSGGYTFIYNRRRQLVAKIQLPAFTEGGHSTPLQYFLCNNHSLTGARKPGVYSQALAVSLGSASRCFFDLAGGLLRALAQIGNQIDSRKLVAGIKRKNRMQAGSKERSQMANRREAPPVWTTLRLTA